MKLSELSTDQSFDVLCELSPHVHNITHDDDFLSAVGRGIEDGQAYIKQFNAMEAALQGKAIERHKGIAVRQALTKALQQSNEDARMRGHAYSNYTNCIYKELFGMSAAQLREQFGISRKENLRDCFSQEELRAIQSMECLVSGLVDCGWEYAQAPPSAPNRSTPN